MVQPLTEVQANQLVEILKDLGVNDARAQCNPFGGWEVDLVEDYHPGYTLPNCVATITAASIPEE